MAVDGVSHRYIFDLDSNTSTRKAFSHTREGLLIQALKNLGKEHIDQFARAQIAKFLKDSTEKEIRKNLKFAPAWMRTLLFEIMEFKRWTKSTYKRKINNDRCPMRGNLNYLFDGIFFWFFEPFGGGWTRTNGVVRRGIYSPLQLPLCDTPRHINCWQ